MFHGMKKGLHKSLDGTILREESQENIEKMQETQEKGEKYLEVKADIERAIETVEQSELSDEEKRVYLEELKTKMEKLKQDFEEKVSDQMEQLQEKQSEVIEQFEALTEEHERQTEVLKEVQNSTEASGIDSPSDYGQAIQEADAKREAYDQTREEILRDQKLRKEQMGMMMRQMRADKVGKIGS